MSQTVLSGDLTVYFLAENRQQRIVWSGSATGTRTINEVYSALQDLFDEPGQMDDGSPMSAQTPVEYTIGIIDQGAKDPWFIDQETMEHIYGGALQTASWTHADGTNTGIVMVTRDTSTNIVSGDIGFDITHADGDSGVLLYVEGNHLWIRPDDNTAGNSFDSTTGGNLTCNAHVDPMVSGAGSDTGESLWANVYSIGASLDGDDETHLYIEQDGGRLISIASGATEDWWPDGHIDITVLVKELDQEVDEAVIVAYQRKYSQVYAYFETDLSAGGRNPLPLSIGNDLNVVDGPYSLTLSGASGTWTAGESVYTGGSWAAATKKGILTEGGTGATPTLDYYLIGDLTQFVDTETLDSRLTAATGTINGAPANNTDGPLNLAGLGITHAHDATFDIDNDGTAEDYSIVIDCSDERLSDVYMWSQYQTRRGETGTSNTDGIAGQFYRGIDVKIAYTTLLGTVGEGTVVTQDTSGATGTIVAHDTTNKVVTLRNSRGTFNTSNDIVLVDATHELQGPHTINTVSPNAGAPFGTFAGGTWFLAFGVVLNNVNSLDANNYQALANDGIIYTEPTSVTVEVTNTRAQDRISIFELTAAGGVIKKDSYTIDATQGAAPQTSVKVDPDIGQYRPSAGRIIWVDDSASVEYVYRYTSYTGDVFTLFTVASTTNDSATTTQITDAGAFSSVKVGDLVYNSTRTAYAYVTEVVSSNVINLDREITGQTDGDSYEIGTTRSDYDAADTLYVPYLLEEETVGTEGSPGSESISVIYNTDVPVLVRVRQAGDILPFEAPSTISDTGSSTGAIRNPDTIYTP